MKQLINKLWSAHDKHERWQGLYEIHHKLPDHLFYSTFVEVWANSESNDQNLDVIDSLIAKRKIKAKTVMPHLDVLDQNIWLSLDKPQLIYRGATKENPYGDYSWTLDKEKAIWFANRCHTGTPILITGYVNPLHIIFVYDGRNEKEVAVKQSLVRKKTIEVIGDYKEDKYFELFSLVQSGYQFGDPVKELTFRLETMYDNIVHVKEKMYEEVNELISLGFTSVPTKRKALLDKINWSKLCKK